MRSTCPPSTKKVSCEVARRMVLGEVQRAEVVPLGLDLGPVLDRVAERGEEARDISRSITLTGCRRPRGGAAPGSETSRRPLASDARLAGRARARLARASAPAPRCAALARLAAAPSAARSSGASAPSPRSTPESEPFLPRKRARDLDQLLERAPPPRGRARASLEDRRSGPRRPARRRSLSRRSPWRARPARRRRADPPRRGRRGSCGRPRRPPRRARGSAGCRRARAARRRVDARDPERCGTRASSACGRGRRTSSRFSTASRATRTSR